MNGTEHFCCERFWVPKGGLYSLADGGYLVDPEREHAWIDHTNVVSEGALSTKGCVVLLGEPGTGKSESLKKLSEEIEHLYGSEKLLYVDLRSFSDENRLYREIFGSAKWTAWVNDTYTLAVLLDSLDECLIHIRTLAAFFVDEFRKYPVSRFSLRIACRTAEWPQLLDKELPAIWGNENFGLYEILPLRRKDVEAIAHSKGIDDVQLFMKVIEHHSMEPFAIKPITLLMLIEEYKKTGSLINDHAGLYLNYCLHLCDDSSLSRRASGASGVLSGRQRLAIAKRIAAVTMFGKKSAIYKGSDEHNADHDQDVVISELAGGIESANGLQFKVTRDAILEVLRTGLFSGGMGERMVWSHWTYAEFLAAQYLVEHGLTNEQITDLIFHPERIVSSDRMLIPQLQETAAWLAMKRRAVFHRILRSDPQALLRSPVSQADTTQRIALVSSLLDLAAAEQITDSEFGIRQNYERLRHAGLANQLRPYITDRSKGFLVRRMAIDIAEACKTLELTEDLLQISLDETEEVNDRIQAAHALVEIGNPQTKEQLRPLLEAGDVDDRDELKGCALRALWPEHMAAGDLFKYITPPKRENYYGMYDVFLSQELVSRLRPADLPVALTWVKEQPENQLSFRLQDLISEILQKAWEHLDDKEVLDPFAQVTIKRLENFEPVLGSRDVTRREDLKLDDTNKRRRLIEAVIEGFKGSDFGTVHYSAVQQGLVCPDDMFWLIEKLQAHHSLPQELLWAKMIRAVFNHNSVDHVKAVLEAGRSSSALSEEFAVVFNAIEIDSPQAEKEKKLYRQGLRLERRKEKKIAAHPPMRELVDQWLEKFEAGDTGAWWRLNLDMTLESDSDMYPLNSEFESDLTSLPGWKEIEDPTRERIIQAAADYLDRGDPHTNDWLGKNVLHRPAAAGYRSLLLLRKLRPDLLEKVSDEAWAKWAPIVLAFPESPSLDAIDTKKAMIALAYAHAPEPIISTLMALIDMENHEHGHISVSHKLERAWDAGLVRAVLDKIESDTNLKPAGFADLLKEPVARDFPEAQQFAATLVKPNLEPGSNERERAKYSAALLLIHCGERGWEVVKHLLDNDVSLGREVIAEVARRHDQGAKLVELLDERSVADLYLWIAAQFPPSEDPDFDRVHWVSERESIANLRNSLLQRLREKGTPDAVEALGYIATRLPNWPWMKYMIVDARQRTLRTTWRGLSPEAIIKVASSNECRLVDSGEQLVEVVVASLQRLQVKLHDETPAVYDLWNDNSTPKEENRISDRIKRHLEEDLKGRGIVANREVEIRKGEETDIHIDAVSSGHEIIKMIVEVKGCWNQHLRTAMQNQLRDRYLRDNRCPFGLYVVAWFLCEKWDESDYRKKRTPPWTQKEASDYFEAQATGLSSAGITLRAFVLDATFR